MKRLDKARQVEVKGWQKVTDLTGAQVALVRLAGYLGRVAGISTWDTRLAFGAGGQKPPSQKDPGLAALRFVLVLRSQIGTRQIGQSDVFPC